MGDGAGVACGTAGVPVIVVSGRETGAVLTVSDEVRFIFEATIVSVSVRLFDSEGLLIETVYTPGGISTWNPYWKYPP
ncbi:MAG: hypothetical protein WBC56_01280, partial [Methanoregula sp.]